MTTADGAAGETHAIVVAHGAEVGAKGSRQPPLAFDATHSIGGGEPSD